MIILYNKSLRYLYALQNINVCYGAGSTSVEKETGTRALLANKWEGGSSLEAL